MRRRHGQRPSGPARVRGAGSEGRLLRLDRESRSRTETESPNHGMLRRPGGGELSVAALVLPASTVERAIESVGRGDRVVEGACLESMCRGNSTVGSNPTLSAIPGLENPGLAGGLTNGERCQSGRMGRSRKPLTAQAVRGFESHPLRHPPGGLTRSPWTAQAVVRGSVLILSAACQAVSREVPGPHKAVVRGSVLTLSATCQAISRESPDRASGRQVRLPSFSPSTIARRAVFARTPICSPVAPCRTGA